jgi:cathepsin L
MKAILLVALLVGLAAASFTEQQYQDAFQQWMGEQGKVYTSSDFFTRYNAFKGNMDYVEEWNSKKSQTILGLNKFADLTNAEYRKFYLGTKITVDPSTLTFVDSPTAVTRDWRTSGAVTPIKDQGQCGSCWSFSTTGSVEGAHFQATKKLVSLSEQNLMDCSTAYGNQGCNGGLMDSAFRYIIANKGIDTEASYPYTAKDGTSCRFSTANIGATIKSYTDVASKNEAALVKAIDINPVSVAIDASKTSFQLYKAGVYYEPACSSTSLDHGVLAVGYGVTDDGAATAYYIVKNSWGTGWGMNGYINMSRNRNNNCGIATSASYPTA